MKLVDILRFAARAASAYPLRTGLMILAMSIGVAAVVVLTALGDGARRYVVNEFSSIGSNLIIVLPGRTETRGLSPATLMTETPRDLTVEDAEALTRVPGVRYAAPLTLGNSEAAYAGRLRDVLLVGTSAAYADIRQLKMAVGRFLPEDERAQVVVIGSAVHADLFGNLPAVGRMLRIGDRRFRVVGVLASFGQGLGMNADDAVILPVRAALNLFNTNTLFRILVEARGRDAIPATRAQVLAAITARHDGEEDVTVITQDAVLATFDRILGALTFAVAGIAGISLAVAGILVMNVMLVAVTQRTAEIGLLKALGATSASIRNTFLVEAALLSMAGAVIGLLLGHGGSWLLRQVFDTLPAYPPDWAVFAGLATALITGVVSGGLPARRAAALDPITALAKR